MFVKRLDFLQRTGHIAGPQTTKTPVRLSAKQNKKKYNRTTITKQE